MKFLAVSTLSTIVAASAIKPPGPIKLAIKPKCGDFTSDPADVNSGLLPLTSYKTIVSFGVCFFYAYNIYIHDRSEPISFP
jgi:hypothetical protein